MRFEAGAELGRYTIEALLGEGGMGEVYCAYDTLLHRKVALKILRAAAPDGSADASRAVSRIFREARVAAALHHPNAVSIFDLGEHEGVHFLAMELVSGRPLRELVGRPEVPLEQRVRWLADIGRALDAAHKAGIVHLDIKPENILVRADAVVKVLDFGIARSFVFDHDPLAPHAPANAQASTMAGTPRYMAPEQVRRQKLDGRTDQFSWGVVAYELLAGAPPWGENQSLFDTFFAIAHESPPSLRGRNPEVPIPLAAVVTRALAKEPEKRFPTMGELVFALEQVFPQLAPMPSWLPKARPVAGAPADPTKPVTRSSEQTAPDTAADLLGVTAEDGAGAPPPDAKTTATTTLEVLHAPPSERAPKDAQETKEAAVNGAKEAPASAPPAGTQQGLRRRLSLGALALGALCAAGIGGRALLASRAAAPKAEASITAPSAPTAGPPVPTTMTDLPPPSGCNAASLAAYRAGIQAQHDGDWDEAHRSFERAVEADADCAAAHLRLTMTGHTKIPPSRLREIYRRAAQLRASLSERDRGLLDALDPLVRRDPSDVQAFADRLRALSARFVGDAELHVRWGEVIEDREGKIAQGRAALAIDPHYSDAFQLIASALAREGRIDEANRELEECLRAAPNSIDCIKERMDLIKTMGRCEEAEGNARLWIARDPKSPNGYAALAWAFSTQGKPAETIEEALRQRWSRLGEPERSSAEPLEQAWVDALTGRFDRAAAEARKAAQLVEDDPSYDAHVRPALLLVNLAIETDKGDEAAEIAADFRGRRGVWGSSLARGTFGHITFHLEPLMLDAERDAHKISEAEWRAARAAWLSSARDTGRFDEQTLWTLGTAMPVRTPEEARSALSTMPPHLRSVQGDPSSSILAAAYFIGRALLLAGETDEAILFLRHAVTHCDTRDIPFEETRAFLWLAQALEKKGDAQGACAAYQVVVGRWGSAAPPSRTAAIAKTRLKPLRCGPFARSAP